jgi:penicillin-binding protein 1A
MKPKQENRRVIQKSTAELLRSAMEDVITRGTGTPAQFSGTDIAGKSGTTDSSRDLWFVGFSPSLCCGIWGGYDNNAPQGSSGYVKSIWRAIMSRGQTGSTSFESASDLKRYTICTKCGKLAVSGTCDHTVQGDMTREEYFAPSSVPTEMCDCHVKVTICKESGQPAGPYCIHTEQQAYLVSGTAGTADADAVKPASIGTGTCPIHTNFWDILKPKDSEKDNDDKDKWKNNWGFGWLDDFW